MKKLTRSRNKVISGVLGGFAEKFGMNATLLRVVFALFVLATGIFPGVILYGLAVLVMPEAGTARSHDARTA